MNVHADVVVIGAGICGLAAAYRARTAGASVVVLESSDAIGGVMRTDVADGFLMERGPTSMAPSVTSQALLTDLGLGGEIVIPPAAAKRRYIVRNGIMHALPSSPPAFLRTRLLSTRGKLRALAEPLVPRRDPLNEESLGALVRRRFGVEVLEYFVDPFVNGVCAGDPERLSSRHTLRVLDELEQSHGSIVRGMMKRKRANGSLPPILSFRGGMGELPRALGRALAIGDDNQSSTVVRTGCRVTRVRQLSDAWEITFEASGATESVRTSSIVCATPAHALPAIEWPEAWRPGITRLAAVSYAPISTVALAFVASQLRHPLDGFGVLFPGAEHRAILGALFNSSMFPGRAPEGHHLLTAFVGGSRAKGVTGPDDAVRMALAELRPLLGVSGKPLRVSVAQWTEGIPQFEIGHAAVVQIARELEARTQTAHTSAIFTGSYLSGVSVADCLDHGLDAGARAAGGRPASGDQSRS